MFSYLRADSNQPAELKGPRLWCSFFVLFCFDCFVFHGFLE